MFTLKDLKEKKEKEKSFTIPEHGPHVAEIVKAVEEENSVGTGSILKLTMTIEEGPSKGVFIYDSINFSNVDEYTQKREERGCIISTRRVALRKAITLPELRSI